ncbi:MAG: DUF2561 family protein [Kofleriaceae bacterium]|jgi:hypothetical protein|nr:DUF2561 family protein [Kofleriaceae bacterium]
MDGSPSKDLCPRCGVAVTPGYVKCPKCHARLPSRLVAPSAAGGTVAPSAQDARSAWLFGGIGVGVVIIVGAIALASGGGRKARPDPVPNTSPDLATPTGAGSTPGSGPIGPGSGVATSAGGDREGAAARLQRALQRANLWSTVSVRADQLRIESALCADPGVAAAVAAAAAELKAAGVTAAVCVESHGQIVFERGL